jgi:hypothetical protein
VINFRRDQVTIDPKPLGTSLQFIFIRLDRALLTFSKRQHSPPARLQLSAKMSRANRIADGDGRSRCSEDRAIPRG